VKRTIYEVSRCEVSPSSYLVGPNIILSIPFSDDLIIYSPVRARDQVSHPFRITGKIIVFVYIFWIGEGKTKYSEPNDSKHIPNLKVLCNLNDASEGMKRFTMLSYTTDRILC